jgi:hypothetical protein
MTNDDEFVIQCQLLHSLNEPIETPFVQWRDSDMFFDRFDARHLLDSLPASRTANDAIEPQADVLNRLRRLPINDSDDEEDDRDDRKRAAIPFTYGDDQSAKKAKSDEELHSEYYDERSRVPLEINVPRDSVRRAVIQRTASFVREQGDRAEIALKLREGDNYKFSFLLHTHADFEYYKWLKRAGQQQQQQPQPPPVDCHSRQLELIEKTSAHAAKLDGQSQTHERGDAFLDTLRNAKATDAQFAFLRPSDAMHAQFLAALARARASVAHSSSS